MAGHNKWKQIKHKKAATDAVKSKVFSKHARFIALESKRAGGAMNAPSLKAAIERARKDNMPSENIDRAVKKGIGGEAGAIESITYEAYGPGGAAMMIDTITDSRNRTAAELKHLMSEQGLALAEPGAASWAFAKEGMEWKAKTTMALSPEDMDKLSLVVETLLDHNDVQDVYTNVAYE